VTLAGILAHSATSFFTIDYPGDTPAATWERSAWQPLLLWPRRLARIEPPDMFLRSSSWITGPSILMPLWRSAQPP